MKLEKKVLKTIVDNGLLSPGSTVICALSGGADSTALCRVLSDLSSILDIKLIAAHVNHCIRGSESDRDEQFSRKLAAALEIQFFSVRIDVPKLAHDSSLGLEECARNARYEYLMQLSKTTGAGFIATAHNADDNLETAMINLIRGSGIRGVSGIPLKRRFDTAVLIRPLLYTSREEIEKYLLELGQSYVVDSTNLSDDYSRNHIRHNVISLLKDINPSVIDTYVHSSQLLSQQSDFLIVEADHTYSEIKSDSSLPIKKLLELHPAIQGDMISRLYADCAGDNAPALSYQQIDSVLRICRSLNPSAQINLPAGFICRREYTRLTIVPDVRDADSIEPVFLNEGETSLFNGFAVSLRKTETVNTDYRSAANFFVDCSKIYGKLFIRARMPGDEIHLAGHAHRSSLKKLMIDRKIPRNIRDKLPVIADESGVVCVAYAGVDERVKIDNNSREFYEITIDKL